ncbi:nitroreductase family protein [candidate division KSB1 bacterium]|nr:nitroreductase family protein [candidate division KSB1 bacterium]
MKIRDLIVQNRSYRRFWNNHSIDMATLRELIDLARLSPSAANRQPLKYFLSNTEQTNALIYSHIAWAGYLSEWSGPEDEEKPSAYIILLIDKNIAPEVDCDHGIAAQSILLGAVEKGLGGCIFGSVQRGKLSKALSLSPELEILLVIAIGKPREVVVLEEVGPEGDIKYWRDDEQAHHVPKRKLDDIIVSQ